MIPPTPSSAPLPVGVVLPTLNVRPQLARHLEQMRAWASQVAEIIVVDSHSTDGTLEFLRAELHHPRLQILQCPPGLYQAWNYAVSQVSAPFTYISTIGDALNPEGLQHLVATATDLRADVVISRPRLLDATGRVLPDKRWPIDHLLAGAPTGEPRCIDPALAFLVATLDVPEGILGSSASNLYRTEALRRFPFPTEYGHEADTAWGIAHAFDVSLAITPRVFSDFVFNSGAGLITEDQKDALIARLLALARQAIGRQLNQSPPAVPEPLLPLLRDLPDEVQRLRDCQRRYDRARRETTPWFLSMRAWQARAQRNRQRVRLEQLKAEVGWHFGWNLA